MRFNFPKTISLFLVGVFMLSACGGGGSDPKPTDSEKPSITTEFPTVGREYAMTQPFMYKGTFTDDTELNNVKFSLEVDQSKAASASLKVATGIDDPAWAPKVEAIMLSEKSQTVDQAIFSADYEDDGTGTMGIPSGVYTGNYILTITCTDKAGNETAETVSITIW